jgi:hypothetical protein
MNSNTLPFIESHTPSSDLSPTSPSLLALTQIFENENLPWFIQSMDVVRRAFHKKFECCSLITHGCKGCLERFPGFVRDKVSYRNKILAIFNSQDIPRHHIALSLFNCGPEAMFGNMNFCSSDFSKCFYDDILDNKYRYKDHRYLKPYCSLYSYHKNDEVINELIGGSDFMEIVGTYYICAMSLLNVNYRDNVLEVFPNYMDNDIESIRNNLGINSRYNVGELALCATKN